MPSWMETLDRYTQRGTALRDTVTDEGMGGFGFDSTDTSTGSPFEGPGVVDPTLALDEPLPANQSRHEVELKKQYKADQGMFDDRYAADMGYDVSEGAWRTMMLSLERGDAAAARRRGDPLRAGTAPRKRVTGHQYTAAIFGMDPKELEEYQRELFAAGFYGSAVGKKDEEPLWGVPDEATTNAAKLVAYATIRSKGRMSIAEVIDMYRMQIDEDGDGIPDAYAKSKADEEAAKPKPVIQLTNPIDINQAADVNARQLMGRRMAAGEEGGMVGGYQGLESSSQFAIQTAQIENTGGTFTAAPSVSAYTEDQLRRTHAPEVDSYTYLKNINTLLQSVGLA